MLARAVTRKSTDGGISETGKALIVAAAAMFPDIDYLSFWVNPYLFITQWHRGITHSLIMLPLWALLLGSLISWIGYRRQHFKQCVLLCALGMLSHIALDLCTVYGTQIFAPLNRYRAALSLNFDLDPWFALAAASALLGSYYRRSWARWGVLGLGLCLIGQAYLQSMAADIGRDYARLHSGDDYSVHALPQPISPWHWKLVVERPGDYQIAHLSLLPPNLNATVKKIDIYPELADYARSDQLEWSRLEKFGEVHQRALILQV